jgi:hypothetical protein
MTGILRGVASAVSVAAVFAGCLIVAAAHVEFELTYPEYGSPALRNAAFDLLMLVAVSGILPSLVLRKFRIQNIAAYLVAGALSGLLAVYLFVFEFGETFTLFGGTRPAPPFDHLLIKVFSQLSGLVTEAPKELLVELGAAVPGALFGGLFWLLAVRRKRRD